MKRIRELNEIFYDLYGRLYENTELLTKRQRDAVSTRLLKQYEVEYQKIASEKQIEDLTALYDLRLQKGFYVPFSFLFIKNKLAKLMALEVKNQAEEYFKKYSKKINEEKEGFLLENTKTVENENSNKKVNEELAEPVNEERQEKKKVNDNHN